MVDLGPLAPSRAWLVSLAEPGKPCVVCWLVSSHVGADGEPYDTCVESVALPPDDAGDLIGRPRVAAETVAQNLTMTGVVLSTWRVSALGFIEQEAVAAHDEAVEALLARIAEGERQ